MVTAQPNLELIASSGEIIGLRDQETENGKSITRLHFFDHKIFLGYGDGGANTGPIEIVYYDCASNKIKSSGFLASTECIRLFQEHKNKLFIPNYDPKPEIDDNFGSVFSYDTINEEWTKESPVIGALHVFGITSFDGKLMICTGSDEKTPGVVASSLDTGKTWQIELSINPISNDTLYEYVRFSHLSSTTKTAFVSGHRHKIIHDSIQDHVPIAYYARNEKWNPVVIEKPLGYLRSFALNDSLYIVPSFSEIDTTYNHCTFAEGVLSETRFFEKGTKLISGVVESFNENIPKDWFIGVFETNKGKQHIGVTTNFRNWINILNIAVELNETFLSATCDQENNYIYLGTKSGKLYRFNYAIDEILLPTKPKLH
jgi:hypothetical protein